MNSKVKLKEVPKKKPNSINVPKCKRCLVSIKKKKMSKQLKELKMEKNSLLLLLCMVFRVILSINGIKIKQNFKSFSLKVPQMQLMETPRRSPRLKKNETVYLGFYSLRGRRLSTSGPIIKAKANILSK